MNTLRHLAQWLGFAIVVGGLPFEPHVLKAQYPPTPFPVLEVDSAVRARLAEEWSATNRYQHERGYCVRFSTELHPATFYRGAIVVYTLTAILRSTELEHSQSSVTTVCARSADVTLLHVHPPYYCSAEDNGASCSWWDTLAHQCFPSMGDVAVLLQSGRPFDLIQCDQWGIAPFWRRSYL
jgi:hypothetical protein